MSLVALTVLALSTSAPSLTSNVRLCCNVPLFARHAHARESCGRRLMVVT